jgi:hypothetical protein
LSEVRLRAAGRDVSRSRSSAPDGRTRPCSTSWSCRCPWQDTDSDPTHYPTPDQPVSGSGARGAEHQRELTTAGPGEARTVPAASGPFGRVASLWPFRTPVQSVYRCVLLLRLEYPAGGERAGHGGIKPSSGLPDCVYRCSLHNNHLRRPAKVLCVYLVSCPWPFSPQGLAPCPRAPAPAPAAPPVPAPPASPGPAQTPVQVRTGARRCEGRRRAERGRAGRPRREFRERARELPPELTVNGPVIR